jgi:hypothetical protein
MAWNRGSVHSSPGRRPPTSTGPVERVAQPKRSVKKSAIIIGSSAVVGAGVGAAIGEERGRHRRTNRRRGALGADQAAQGTIVDSNIRYPITG